MFFSSTRRLLTATTVTLTFLSSPPMALHAQDGRPTFRASVALVPITAVVRDAKNRVVRELQKDDFDVFEGNERRRVVDFSATERGPVSLGVLIDTSGSMRGANLHKGKAVVGRLLDELTQPADEAALFTFDKGVRQGTAFTNDRDELRAALNPTEGWGLTSLYDAIADTARQLGRRQAQRRALIVVTDGVDTSSTMTTMDVSALASAIDVPVYILSVESTGPVRDNAAHTAREDALADLARWTGGDLRHVGRPDLLGPAVAALMAELRQQYFLAIESAAAAGWYRLDVRTRRKGLTVRARSGYFATPTS